MHQQPIKNFFNLQNNYFHKCVLKTSVTSVPHKYFSHSYQMLGFCYLDKASGGQYNTFFHRTCIKIVFTCSSQPTWPLWYHTNTSNSSQDLKLCAWHIFLCNFMTSLLAAPMIVLYSIHRELQHEKHTSTGSGTFGFLINMQWFPPILDRSSLKEYRPLAIKIW